jgi:hypothetical protein
VFGGAGTPATEAQAQFYITEAATLSYFQAYIFLGGSGTNTVTLRDTGVNTSVTANRSGTGALSDTTNSATLAAADLVNYAFTDTGTDPVYSYTSMVVSFTTGHGNFYSSSGSTNFATASVTRYISIAGELVATATETDAQVKNRAWTSIEAIQVYVSANARTTTTTVRNRINAANGTGTFTIGSGVTGNLRDTTIGDALSSGDLLCISVATSTGTQTLTMTVAGATLKSSTGVKCDLYNHFQSGTFYPIYGVATTGPTEPITYGSGGLYFELGYYTETTAGIPAPYALVASNPRCYLTQNSYAASATYALRKNSANAITVTIGAGATGWFEDTTSAVDYAVNDKIWAQFTSTETNDTLSITIIDVSVTVNQRLPSSKAMVLS